MAVSMRDIKVRWRTCLCKRMDRNNHRLSLFDEICKANFLAEFVTTHQLGNDDRIICHRDV